MRKIIYLTVSSWRGLGGVHYYGSLRSNEEDANQRTDVELSHRIRTDDDFYHSHVASWERKKKFTTSIAFRSEEEIRKEALKWIKKNEPKSILIYGPSYVCDPQTVLYGPKKLMKAANLLNDEADRIGRWEKDESKMKEISKKWEELWGGQIC